MSIQKLRNILEEIDYPVFVEIVDYPWVKEENNTEIWYNPENNLSDLKEAEGDTILLSC